MRSSRFHFQGFSLIEIVLAVGVISFALIGILGMFPIAINSATESQRETQAALISRNIVNDLIALPGTNTYLLLGKNDRPEETTRIPIDLTVATNYFLAYDPDAQPLNEKIDGSTFTSGKNNAGFVAMIEILTNNIPVGLSRVNIYVEAPGGAPQKARKSYLFTSLLRQDAAIVPLPTATPAP